MMTQPPLLQVEHLCVTFGDEINAVKDMSFSLRKGETLCLVGPSGCGKSVTASALLGLLPAVGGCRVQGSIRWQGREYIGAPGESFRAVRGRLASLVLQESRAALDPVRTVGWQLSEVLKTHTGLPRKARREQMLALLREVGLPNPAIQAAQYPHQLSGGMCQRVMIALALASAPALLIADEPTTALDATVQAQILELLDREKRARKMAMLLITHDMGVVARMADRVVVMSEGRDVESGAVEALFASPGHPVTRRLLDCAGGKGVNP